MRRNAKRDLERFMKRSEVEARRICEDPEYFKPKSLSLRISRATKERIRVLKRDVNTFPLFNGHKIANTDQLLNVLLDGVKNGDIIMDTSQLIALHTEDENGESGSIRQASEAF